VLVRNHVEARNDGDILERVLEVWFSALPLRVPGSSCSRAKKRGGVRKGVGQL